METCCGGILTSKIPIGKSLSKKCLVRTHFTVITCFNVARGQVNKG